MIFSRLVFASHSIYTTLTLEKDRGLNLYRDGVKSQGLTCTVRYVLDRRILYQTVQRRFAISDRTLVCVRTKCNVLSKPEPTKENDGGIAYRLN